MTILKTTPMMEQYFSIKDRYPDAILFYRMGDFYEMFHEDALKASTILEIALTSRNKQQDDAIPMCGVPQKAADVYIAKLIENGCKVAVCEQVEDPATVKGLVKREVVRVITPGMILSEELLDRGSNNYLLALSIVDGDAGMAWLDISTGVFRTTEFPAQNGRIPETVFDEVMRVDPSEILLPESFKSDPAYGYIRKRLADRHLSYIDKLKFRVPDAKRRLMEKFATRSLKGFGCEEMSAGISAAGAVISYMQETQLQDTEHITSITPYSLDSFLIIDERSCRNLELLKNIESGEKRGSLLSVMDRTVTAMGARLLKSWIRYPLRDQSAIEDRLDAVEESLRDKERRNSLRVLLKSVHDLERLGSKISMGQGNARDLIFLKNSLSQLPGITEKLEKFESELLTGRSFFNRTSLNRSSLKLSTSNGASLRSDQIEEKSIEESQAETGKIEESPAETAPIEDMIYGLDALKDELMETADLIEKAIREDAPMVLTEGRMINSGYDSELDELIELSENGKAWIIKEGMKEKERTGLSSLKIKFNRVFGYFIEVSKGQAASVPDNYIRKQTLVNAERFITEELKEVESKVLNAEEKRASLEYEIFSKVREKVVEKRSSILEAARFLATLDVLLCFAENADLNSYTRPSLNSDGVIDITDGRHPVVEKLIAGERYVPNSVRLDNEKNQLLIITGPNMAGKSTVLRQVALQVLMAQTGSFVPAAKADISLTDRIFTRVGALDNLSQGQSTFMVEMEETAAIVNNATAFSLVILDEIGRGTSTFDGLSIAWAVAEYLHDIEGRGVKTLFATHYHELIALEQLKPRVRNFNIAVKEFNDHIIFLRRLVEGGTNRSYGIQVARLAGVPDRVVTRAKEILREIEITGNTSRELAHCTDEEILSELALRSAATETSDIITPAPGRKKQSRKGGKKDNLSDQMDLFGDKDSKLRDVMKRIENLEITRMTPVDALIFLNDIHGVLKK